MSAFDSEAGNGDFISDVSEDIGQKTALALAPAEGAQAAEDRNGKTAFSIAPVEGAQVAPNKGDADDEPPIDDALADAMGCEIDGNGRLFADPDGPDPAAWGTDR